MTERIGGRYMRRLIVIDQPDTSYKKEHDVPWNFTLRDKGFHRNRIRCGSFGSFDRFRR
jgi:hypothetical protein